MINQQQFLQNLQILRQRIDHACKLCGREAGDFLIACHQELAGECSGVLPGCRTLSGRRKPCQEATEKQDQIEGVEWELIGHLQTNKVNQVVGRFSRIQTLDSLKLIRKVQTASERIDCKTAVLLQVNAGNDPAKYGFSLTEAPGALDEVLGCSTCR